jgi:serine/threonine protein kinase
MTHGPTETHTSAPFNATYTIDGELGRGGMATVYLARDRKHDRRVAVKVLHAELAAVVGLDRFLHEIRVTATLQHPHILGLIDSGVFGDDVEELRGRPYYVMPFIQGESLRDRLTREGQLPVPDAVRLATEVASALDSAHRQGVIHRDIKPENILLHDGSALVADFGIALAVQQAGGARLTQTALSLGTPQYMSPEQAMGERSITARSDVYALGAVTYEMLAGEAPFTGPTVQAIVARLMAEAPRPLSGQRRSIPPHVEAAVLRALEKLPADRFVTAAEFATALVTPSALARAREALALLDGPYERAYYDGIICERRARAQLAHGGHGSAQAAREWLKDALAHYARAEQHRPAGNDDAILRWNACVRLLEHHPDGSDVEDRDDRTRMMMLE